MLKTWFWRTNTAGKIVIRLFHLILFSSFKYKHNKKKYLRKAFNSGTTAGIWSNIWRQWSDDKQFAYAGLKSFSRTFETAERMSFWFVFYSQIYTLLVETCSVWNFCEIYCTIVWKVLGELHTYWDILVKKLSAKVKIWKSADMLW